MNSLAATSRSMISAVLSLFLNLSVVPPALSTPRVYSSNAQDAAGPAAPVQDPKTDDQSYYANTHPYIDEPLDSLSRKIPELKKLKASSDQSKLQEILEKAAANVDAFFRNVVDLIVEENITQERSTSFGTTRAQVQDSYLIVRGGDAAPSDVLEYRMDAAGRRIDQTMSRGYLVTSGFALIGNYFSTVSQPESRFRYLGDEKLGSRETYVVGFAQRPGQATQFITMAGPRGTSGNMLVQGIAWVDQSTLQILRLRTDLLAPRPEVGLERQTTEVNFSEIRFQDIANPLWLPQDVKVYLTVKEFDSIRHRFYEKNFRNEHRYTGYRRYRVSVKIAPSN